MFDLVKPALLRLAIYFAPVLFGIVGVFIAKLGLGTYDEAAGTITISREMFVGFVTVMIGSGGTAIIAVLRGWKSKASA